MGGHAEITTHIGAQHICTLDYSDCVGVVECFPDLKEISVVCMYISEYKIVGIGMFNSSFKNKLNNEQNFILFAHFLVAVFQI